MKIIQHRSIILLNIKCPQLSKPKARRNQNSIRRQNGEKKNLGRNQAQSGPVLLWPMNEHDYDSGNITDQKSHWIRTFTIFIQFHLVGGRSHAGMEMSLLMISADGC